MNNYQDLMRRFNLLQNSTEEERQECENCIKDNPPQAQAYDISADELAKRFEQVKHKSSVVNAEKPSESENEAEAPSIEDLEAKLTALQKNS